MRQCTPKHSLGKKDSCVIELIVGRPTDRGLKYRVDVRPEGEGFRIAVHLDDALPSELVGKAGFNLEFVPDLYFGKSFVTGGTTGIFPPHSGGKAICSPGPMPIARAMGSSSLPEDPLSRVTINSEAGSILLLDGRNVMRLSAEGDWRKVFTGQVRPWRKWMRYAYSTLSISRKCESLESTRSSMQVNVPKRVCCRRGNFFHSCRKPRACRKKVGQMSDQLWAILF